MNKEIKAMMRKITRKLDHYADLEQSHCGHDDLVDEAKRKRAELLEFIRECLEEAVAKTQSGSPWTKE